MGLVEVVRLLLDAVGMVEVNMRMSNETYDRLKWIAQIFLPALGTLYFALATIWGLPYGEQIVGTITAVDAFLGALLKISTDQYMEDRDAAVDE